MYFLMKLYEMKYNSVWKDHQINGGREKELEKLIEDQKRWGQAVRTDSRDLPTLNQGWETIQREWLAEDLKKGK